MTGRPDIAEVQQMGREQLLALWSDTFDEPAPKGLSQPFLRRFLAFELQARRQGGLPKAVQRALEKEPGTRKIARTRSLKPGARLLREWYGVTHVVDVTDAGYLWRGETHRSLSAIARQITGARWSGPRFFGLGGKTAR